MCKQFLEEEGPAKWNRKLLEESYPKKYKHYKVDIRNHSQMERIFQEYQNDGEEVQ